MAMRRRADGSSTLPVVVRGLSVWLLSLEFSMQGLFLECMQCERNRFVLIATNYTIKLPSLRVRSGATRGLVTNGKLREIKSERRKGKNVKNFSHID